MPMRIDHRSGPSAVVSTFTGLSPVRVVMFQRTERTVPSAGGLVKAFARICQGEIRPKCGCRHHCLHETDA